MYNVNNSIKLLVLAIIAYASMSIESKADVRSCKVDCNNAGQACRALCGQNDVDCVLRCNRQFFVCVKKCKGPKTIVG